MTERQIRLKDEIIEIADRLQLGIYKDDPDWFFQFINRMNIGVYLDSYRSNHNGWCKLDGMDDLSLDFIREFMHRFDWRGNWLRNKNKLPITEVLPLINDYIMTWDWAILNKIAQSEELTDELVLKYEKLFDQTCEYRGRNGGPGMSDYTAWYYIVKNKKVSNKIKELAAGKMQYNDKSSSDDRCNKKSLLEKIFRA